MTNYTSFISSMPLIKFMLCSVDAVEKDMELRNHAEEN